MKLKTYLKKCVDIATNNGETYDRLFFTIPRIYCKDGFNISIQVANGSYCESNNGVRTYGNDWLCAEWGFPSEPIDAEKYHASDDDTMNSVGGYVDVNLLQELLDEHGGIDTKLMGNICNDLKYMSIFK